MQEGIIPEGVKSKQFTGLEKMQKSLAKTCQSGGFFQAKLCHKAKDPRVSQELRRI